MILETILSLGTHNNQLKCCSAECSCRLLYEILFCLKIGYRRCVFCTELVQWKRINIQSVYFMVCALAFNAVMLEIRLNYVMDRGKKWVKYLYRLREQCRISSSKKWITSIINNVCLDTNIMFSYLPAPLIVKITSEVIPNFLRLSKHTLCFVMTQILSSRFFSKYFVLQNKKHTVCVNKLLLCIQVCLF